MNVGNERNDEGSSSEADSDEKMVADVQVGEHVEPTAVAGEGAGRFHAYLLGDEALTRSVRNPKDPVPEERELQYKRRH